MDSAPATPTATRKKGFLLLGVVFLLGVVCGGALVFIGVRTLVPRGPRHGGPHPIEGISRHLDLNEKQAEKIRAILDETRHEIDVISLESRDRIREVLTPEQLEKFDEMRSRFRRGPRRRHRDSPEPRAPRDAPPPPPSN